MLAKLDNDGYEILSPKETQVLLTLRDHSISDTAIILNLSARSLEKYLHNIRDKLGIATVSGSSSLHLVLVKALRKGIISLFD